MADLRTIDWVDGKVRILDQTRLPERTSFLWCEDAAGVVEAIKNMRVRGAPAIGIAAALGLALEARRLCGVPPAEFTRRLQEAAAMLRATRPTAVNLAWALDRTLAAAHGKRDSGEMAAAMAAEALAILREDVETNRRLGAIGAQLIGPVATVLTHCNAGALATADYGTALGVIRAAREQGKQVSVYVDETRPLLQGARLTAWELLQDGIPVTLITDSMAGHFMSRGRIDLVIVGADRIAANGDTANKIGTYTLAVLARENRVPFYVAAPTSTIDGNTPDGSAIPIEERPMEEVTRLAGRRVAPEGVVAANPAFDVTPARYITAIITEKGVARQPLARSLRSLLQAGS